MTECNHSYEDENADVGHIPVPESKVKLERISDEEINCSIWKKTRHLSDCKICIKGNAKCVGFLHQIISDMHLKLAADKSHCAECWKRQEAEIREIQSRLKESEEIPACHKNTCTEIASLNWRCGVELFYPNYLPFMGEP